MKKDSTDNKIKVVKRRNGKYINADGTYTTEYYEKEYRKDPKHGKDSKILLSYFRSNFDDDYYEFKKAQNKIKREIGIGDFSSSKDLSELAHYTRWVGWIYDVVQPEDIRKYILEDLSKIKIFKGEISSEKFDFELDCHLDEIACQLCPKKFYSSLKEHIGYAQDRLSPDKFIKSIRKYFSISDFEFTDDVDKYLIIPFGGVKIDKNRYIYCFLYFHMDDPKHPGTFIGREFVVDEEGKIHDGMNEWITVSAFALYGKDVFFDTYFDLCWSESWYIDAYYVPSLIVLYAMAKYLIEDRDKKSMTKK